MTFRSLFCASFGCSPAEYEERAFRGLLYWHARILAPAVRAIKPDFFLEDFKFIRYLGDAVDARQAKVDVLDFRDMDRKRWQLLHSGLRIRVSHRKARRLVFQLFGKAGQDDDAVWQSLK
ncbi:MAG: hypothetical protein ABSG59_00345 [Verrucomicrobiota bacterium]